MAYQPGTISGIGQSVSQFGQNTEKRLAQVQAMMDGERLMKDFNKFKESVKATVIAKEKPKTAAEIQAINSKIDAITDKKQLMDSLGAYEAQWRSHESDPNSAFKPTFGLDYQTWLVSNESIKKNREKAAKEQQQKDITGAVGTVSAIGGPQVPYAGSAMEKQSQGTAGDFSQPAPEYPVGSPVKNQVEFTGAMAQNFPNATMEDFKNNPAFQAKAIGMPSGSAEDEEKKRRSTLKALVDMEKWDAEKKRLEIAVGNYNANFRKQLRDNKLQDTKLLNDQFKSVQDQIKELKKEMDTDQKVISSIKDEGSEGRLAQGPNKIVLSEPEIQETLQRWSSNYMKMADLQAQLKAISKGKTQPTQTLASIANENKETFTGGIGKPPEGVLPSEANWKSQQGTPSTGAVSGAVGIPPVPPALQQYADVWAEAADALKKAGQPVNVDTIAFVAEKIKKMPKTTQPGAGIPQSQGNDL